MENKRNKSNNIYEIKPVEFSDMKSKKRTNIKKIISIVLTILIIFLVYLGVKQIVTENAAKAHEIAVAKEEEQKKAEIERIEEEKRQEEIRKQEEMKKQKLTDVGRANISNIYKSETKVAYLTFDDGPSSVTAQILDVLKQNDVKATFFVLGSRVEAQPETVKRIYDEGHYIANHGYSHVYSSIYSSAQAVLDEFNRCNQAVRDAIGNQEFNSYLFRFPGGYMGGGKYANVKKEASDLLSTNNILHVDWNALTGDAEKSTPTVEYEIQRIRETTTNKNSIVVLLHDAQAKKATAEALPQVIGYLKEQGYEFKSFYDVIK